MTHLYRLRKPITVMSVLSNSQQRFVQLPAGSLFFTPNPHPDRDGIVEGLHDGEPVMVFERDLEELAEAVSVTAAPNQFLDRHDTK